MSRIQRRMFLRTSIAAGATVGMGHLSTGGIGGRAWATDSKYIRPRVDDETERLVRLISETPREKAVGIMIDQVRQGISQRSFLSALYVSALRFAWGHRVLVHHPVSQLSLDAPREERLLSLFWHLDHVKSSRPKEPYTAKESQIPSASKAVEFLENSIRAADVDSAQGAVIAIARSQGPRQACELLWRQAAGWRNLQSVGHHAINFANCWRSLEATNWQLAEPVLLYLAMNSAYDYRITKGQDLDESNNERSRRVGDLRPDWAGRPRETEATRDVLAVLREAKAPDACRWVFDRFIEGKLQAAEVWDAIFLTAAESVIRYKVGGPSGRAQHSVTGNNAFHFAFRACADPRVRFYILLQAVHFQCDTLANQLGAGTLRNMKITEIEDTDLPKSVQDAVGGIFADLPPRRLEHWFRDRSRQDKSMRFAYALARRSAESGDSTVLRPFFRTARHLLRRKSTDAHHLKTPIAFFENIQHISPQWRPHLIAASVHNLHGPQTEDNPAVAEAREALQKL
jgi:hypothetical protein